MYRINMLTVTIKMELLMLIVESASGRQTHCTSGSSRTEVSSSKISGGRNLTDKDH